MCRTDDRKSMTMDHHVFDGTFNDCSCYSPIKCDPQEIEPNMAVVTPPHFSFSVSHVLYDHANGVTEQSIRRSVELDRSTTTVFADEKADGDESNGSEACLEGSSLGASEAASTSESEDDTDRGLGSNSQALVTKMIQDLVDKDKGCGGTCPHETKERIRRESRDHDVSSRCDSSASLLEIEHEEIADMHCSDFDNDTSDFTICTRICKLSKSRRRQRDMCGKGSLLSTVKSEIDQSDACGPTCLHSPSETQKSSSSHTTYNRGFGPDSTVSFAAPLNSRTGIVPETPPCVHGRRPPSSTTILAADDSLESEQKVDGCNRRLALGTSPSKQFCDQLSNDSEVLRWATHDCNCSGGRQGVSYNSGCSSTFTGLHESESDEERRTTKKECRLNRRVRNQKDTVLSQAERDCEDFHFTEDESYELSKRRTHNRNTGSSCFLNHSSLAGGGYSVSFNKLQIQTEETPAHTRGTNETSLDSDGGESDDFEDGYVQPRREKLKRDREVEDLERWMQDRERKTGGFHWSHGGFLVGDDAQYPLASSAILQLVLSSWKHRVGPTLVVTTPKHIEHWLAQLRTTSLSIYSHHGNGRRKTCSRTFFLSFDVVLTTYDRVKSVECPHTVAFPPPKKTSTHERRPLASLIDENQCNAITEPSSPADQESKPVWHVKKSVLAFKQENEGSSSRSYLHRVYWHRIVLDDAKLISNASTARSKAIYALQGEKKWCICTTLKNEEKVLASLHGFITATSSLSSPSSAYAQSPLRLCNLDHLLSSSRVH